MSGTRTVFLFFGLVVAAYLFASSLPVLRELVLPRGPGPAPVTLAGVQQSARTLPPPAPLPRALKAPAAVAPPAPATATPAPGLLTPAIDLRQASYGFTGGSVLPGGDSVRFARQSIILRVKPEGRGLIPTSLNRAPLTLRRGTRVAAVEKRGKWWLVQSPSRMLGWVRADELATSMPFVPD